MYQIYSTLFNVRTKKNLLDALLQKINGFFFFSIFFLLCYLFDSVIYYYRSRFIAQALSYTRVGAKEVEAVISELKSIKNFDFFPFLYKQASPIHLAHTFMIIKVHSIFHLSLRGYGEKDKAVQVGEEERRENFFSQSLREILHHPSILSRPYSKALQAKQHSKAKERKKENLQICSSARCRLGESSSQLSSNHGKISPLLHPASCISYQASRFSEKSIWKAEERRGKKIN